MDLVGKIDVLDLIINILKEHEQVLDDLTYRLETIAEINEKHARSS